MNDHDFNSIYVPIRSAIKALLNIDVPGELKDNQYFADEISEDERVSLLSIEKAADNNPDLLGQENFEINDYHNPLEMTEQTAENQRDVYIEFLRKKSYKTNILQKI